MNVCVIGAGHVGTVTAAGMATLGHHAVGLDVDVAKVDDLRRGRMPFHEPGLHALVTQATAAGRLRFTTEPAEALVGAEVVFVCVGTPRSASAVVVCTEWDEYRRLRPDRLRELLAEPVVVDARNVWTRPPFTEPAWSAPA